MTTATTSVEAVRVPAPSVLDVLTPAGPVAFRAAVTARDEQCRPLPRTRLEPAGGPVMELHPGEMTLALFHAGRPLPAQCQARSVPAEEIAALVVRGVTALGGVERARELHRLSCDLGLRLGKGTATAADHREYRRIWPHSHRQYSRAFLLATELYDAARGERGWRAAQLRR